MKKKNTLCILSGYHSAKALNIYRLTIIDGILCCSLRLYWDPF